MTFASDQQPGKITYSIEIEYRKKLKKPMLNLLMALSLKVSVSISLQDFPACSVIYSETSENISFSVMNALVRRIIISLQNYFSRGIMEAKNFENSNIYENSAESWLNTVFILHLYLFRSTSQVRLMFRLVGKN